MLITLHWAINSSQGIGKNNYADLLHTSLISSVLAVHLRLTYLSSLQTRRLVLFTAPKLVFFPSVDKQTVQTDNEQGAHSEGDLREA